MGYFNAAPAYFRWILFGNCAVLLVLAGYVLRGWLRLSFDSAQAAPQPTAGTSLQTAGTSLQTRTNEHDLH